MFTSNVKPKDLYKGGLQRDRFLPTIALLEKHCDVVAVDGGVDYRLRQLTAAPIYLPSGDADHARRSSKSCSTTCPTTTSSPAARSP